MRDFTFQKKTSQKNLAYHCIAKEDQRQDAAMDEMFVEFFDAIDDLSDNEQLEGTSGNHGIIQEVHTGNQYGKRHESTSNCAQLFRQSSVPSWGSQNHLGNAFIYREYILLIHVDYNPPHGGSFKRKPMN